VPHLLDIFINDKLVPYNQTVYEAIRQNGKETVIFPVCQIIA
jgi:hypothetical protein